MLGERKVIETDVLVVGSEGAGSRIAIEVAKNGLKLILKQELKFKVEQKIDLNF